MPPGPAFRNRPAGGATAPGFPPPASGKAFAALVQLVRSGLHGCTVRAWDDPADDGSPPGGEGPPWVRLTPEPGPSRIFARHALGVVHRMPLLVHIETSVPGRQVGQSLALWEAILRALFPGGSVAGPDPILVPLGVARIEVKKPAWAAPMPKAAGDVPARIEALGQLELLMHFTTPE